MNLQIWLSAGKRGRLYGKIDAMHARLDDAHASGVRLGIAAALRGERAYDRRSLTLGAGTTTKAEVRTEVMNAIFADRDRSIERAVERALEAGIQLRARALSGHPRAVAPPATERWHPG